MDENYTSQAFQPYIVGPVTHSNKKENNVFEIWLKIYQECAKIGDAGYIEEFCSEDFLFIILFYLFINNYF